MFKRISKISYELILSITLQFLAFIFMKIAAIKSGQEKLIIYFFSLFFLALQAFFWQRILSREKLSKIYFWYSLSSFVFLIFVNIYFKEQISPQNVLGVLLIIVGFFIISKEK